MDVKYSDISYNYLFCYVINLILYGIKNMLEEH